MENTIRLLSPRSCSLPLTLAGTYDTMMYADIVLTCHGDESGQQYPVGHKSVLASASDFLKSLLESNPESHCLILPDISSSTMIQILSLIYTGEANVIGGQEEVQKIIDGIELLQINCIKQIDIIGVGNFESVGVSEGDEEILKVREDLESGWVEKEIGLDVAVVGKRRLNDPTGLSSMKKKKKLKEHRVEPMVSSVAVPDHDQFEEEEAVGVAEKHTDPDVMLYEKSAALPDIFYVIEESMGSEFHNRQDEETEVVQELIKESTMKDHAYAHQTRHTKLKH